MNPNALEICATVCMGAAVLHTFLASWLRRISHWLGEVELIFAIWALVFLLLYAVQKGVLETAEYLGRLHFGEPLFVFAVMSVMSLPIILKLAGNVIERCARLIPLPRSSAFFILCMTVGPLLGSLITEPAAMTVTALLLLKILSSQLSLKFRYSMLGVLFVNVSIGGTLTHYAAPPVLMVARVWNWDLVYMFTHFGLRAVIAILLNTTLLVSVFWGEIKSLPAMSKTAGLRGGPKIKEAAFVGLFLTGLVILGGLQRWWLEPILTSLTSWQMFVGAIGLTGVVDNAALTFLASQVSGLPDEAKYLVVAGAVTGGGLTVIANAPNPAGQAMLAPIFGREGLRAERLLLGALIPGTAIAALAFWI